MTRTVATNHAGWVVEEFKVAQGEEKARWVRITKPTNRIAADAEKIEIASSNPDAEFRVYEALTMDK